MNRSVVDQERGVVYLSAWFFIHYDVTWPVIVLYLLVWAGWKGVWAQDLMCLRYISLFLVCVMNHL